MYLRSVQIRDVKSIRHLDLNFAEGKEAGWHVILGENGAGKSSLIRAIALALLGPQDHKALRLNLADWIRVGADKAEVWTSNVRDNLWDSVIAQGTGKPRGAFWTGVAISRGQQVVSVKEAAHHEAKPGSGARTLWSNAGGWFSAGFGPFRRLYGGDPEMLRVHFSDPRVGAHLSLFGEHVAMSEALTWLRDLHLKRLEHDQDAAYLLATLTTFLNGSGLLPSNTLMKAVTSEGVSFTDGNGVQVPLSSLSDGFRSMLSLMFELIRQLVRVYGLYHVFPPQNTDLPITIKLPGVVLIDEVDAHLHPTWQTRIGEWFTRFFPRIQFIVTTHSPLICRGVSKGTIWKLPAPSNPETSAEITGLEKDRLVFGDAQAAYGTDVFGKV